MKVSDYDKEFQQEIERILNLLYNKPTVPTKPGIKRSVIEANKKHIDFLIENDLVINLKSVSDGCNWGLQLSSQGHDVFEKYGSWQNYYQSVINKKQKIYRAQEMKAIYWWLPIVISVIALILSTISLL